MSLRTVPESPNAVLIDDANIAFIHADKPALEDPIYWHKFVISNVHGLKRNIVLKILLAHIAPVEIIPLCYTHENEGAYFFARMCKDAIEKLCKDQLTIPNSVGTSKPFKVKIILRYSNTDVVKVNLTNNIQAVLHKRFSDGILTLSDFVEDPDLLEYLPLSQRKLLAFVLNMAKTLSPTTLRLCHNEIKTLDAFQIQSDSLVSLDLRDNLITNLEELKHLSNYHVTELWLEGNPLCDLYDEYNYVQTVIQFCPKIEKLDGYLLRQNGVPSFRRNFLCNVEAYNLVDQFLREYFPAYDTKNLHKLKTFYSENSIFSMTAEYIKEQLSSPNSQIRPYKTFSRNLLHTHETFTTNLFIGFLKITKLFTLLPHSEHDPYSFTVDVLYYTSSCATIMVTGVFRELPNTDRILGFSRYFVLENQDNRYRITNEQMHVFNALTSQQITAFKNPNVAYEARDPTQQSLMVDTFATITNLTKDWAKMFLEECHYNLKHAMFLFVDLYKGDKIPSLGFKSCD